MQELSVLFGKTPRTINRYVNIYRILKAHESVDKSEYYTENRFKPLMFILAVVIGYPTFAEGFINEINKSDVDVNFQVFFNDSKLFQAFVGDLRPFRDDFANFRIKDFKRDLELVSRFSFRTLLQ